MFPELPIKLILVSKSITYGLWILSIHFLMPFAKSRFTLQQPSSFVDAHVTLFVSQLETIMAAKSPHDSSFSFSRRYFHWKKKALDESDNEEEILNFSSSSSYFPEEVNDNQDDHNHNHIIYIRDIMYGGRTIIHFSQCH